MKKGKDNSLKKKSNNLVDYKDLERNILNEISKELYTSNQQKEKKKDSK